MQRAWRPYPIIAGPTASGKTALAVALAQRIGGEVVSADSMQIYGGVSIGTAAPSVEEQCGIPHHLIGFLPLTEKYSVARYVEDADAAFADIFSRGKTPVLCGGTGLYIQSFSENIQFYPQPEDPELRSRLRSEAAINGGESLLQKLAAVDPQSAARLHANDINRIVRALEVYTLTGKTIGQQAAESHAVPSPYDPCLFMLDFRDRQILYDRIDRRVDGMVSVGLIEEARRVLSIDRDATLWQAIGYKELLPYLNGDVSLDCCIEQLKLQTHHYAKRQLSWFRHMEGARTVYVDDYHSSADLTDAVIEEFTKFYEGGRPDAQ